MKKNNARSLYFTVIYNSVIKERTIFMPFSKFKFHSKVSAGLATLGYETPTPIQLQSIPLVMQGRDVLGLAQTGTGKTAAFALPILHRLMSGRTRGQIRAIIIAPTRELAEQTHEFFMQFAKYTGIRSVTIYGGVSMRPQIAKLRAGVDIVVACPGRLIDHLEHFTIKLDSVQILVLDEADRMFDMGFLPDIRKLLKFIPKQRQTLLYSATMPSDIRHLVKEAMNNEILVQIGNVAPVDTVAHTLYPVANHLKTKLLIELLNQINTDSVLIFTRTKHRATRLAKQLRQAGYSATELQGNLSQTRRQESLDGFRDGKYKMMVATDIAARGIDVSLISHVVNYDMPDTTDAYTHRIGRTGRAERTGYAYTFVSNEDAATVRMIEKTLNQHIERRILPNFDYKQPAPPRKPNFSQDNRRRHNSARVQRASSYTRHSSNNSTDFDMRHINRADNRKNRRIDGAGRMGQNQRVNSATCSPADSRVHKIGEISCSKTFRRQPPFSQKILQATLQSNYDGTPLD